MAMASCVSAVAFGAPVTTVEELTAAIAAASDTDPSEIELAATTFELTAQITISKPITLKGASRESTIVTRKSGSIRLFRLNHADAALKDMTVQNGNCGTGSGGNVLLTLGTVENCILQGGKGCSNAQGGSNIAIFDGNNGAVTSSGVVRNCIIRNGLAEIGQNEHSGAALFARKTSSVLIEGCEFYDNKAYCDPRSLVGAGAIAVYSDGNGVVVKKCTFVRNGGVGIGAIYSGNGKVSLQDCLFALNRPVRAGASSNDLKGSYSSVKNCAFDTQVPNVTGVDKATCVAGRLSFVNAAGTDFTPVAFDSVAVGKASDGGDIGVKQSVAPTSLACFAECDKATAAVPFTATFRAAASASSGVSFTWDFGDGSAAVETAEAEVTHEYTATGTYAVRVTASVGGETSAPCSLTVTGAQKDYSVSTVAELTAALAAAGEGAVITLAEGDYEFTAGTSLADYPYGNTALILQKGVTIRGGSSDPTKTTLKVSGNTLANLKNTGNRSRALRLVYLRHPNCRVEGLTLFGGTLSGAAYWVGGAALVDYDGGCLSNCVITASSITGNQVGGSALAMYGGLATHLSITNNFCYMSNSDTGGGQAILFQTGVLRNSLIADNESQSAKASTTYNVGGVALKGSSVLESCTVAGNKSFGCGGVRQYDSGATVRNCQIQGNASSGYGLDSIYQQVYPHASGFANFINCASTVAIKDGTKEGVSCVKGEMPYGDNWRPVYGSVALENGLVQSWMTEAGDLDGNPRLGQDNKVDIGCYQFQKSSVVGSFTLSAPEGPIPSTVAFVATASSEEGAITSYVWDFGDGSDPVETTAPTASHEYTAIGTYLPKLSVKIGAKSYAIDGTATFKAGPAVMHVINAAFNPGEAYPYDDWAKATTNLQTALDAAVVGSRIVLSRGVHTNNFETKIDKACVVSGETADARDTVVWRPFVVAGNETVVRRNVYLDHANARIENLTLAGGGIQDKTSEFGANVQIASQGGTISNCVITGGRIVGTSQNISAGSALAMFNGLVTHSVISNNYSKLANNDNGTGGAVVQLGSGALAFCLVTGNQVNDSILSGASAYKFGRIVSVKDGRLLHCTIVSNDVGRGWTVARADEAVSGAIVNCLIASNKTENALAGHEAAKVFRQTENVNTYAQLDHCFGDAEYAPANPAKYVYDRELSFREDGDAKWLPSAKSLAARRAAAKPETVGAKYLDGTPVPAKHAAAGCYPSWGRIGLMLQVR